jgi:hypothetical protein
LSGKRKNHGGPVRRTARKEKKKLASLGDVANEGGLLGIPRRNEERKQTKKHTAELWNLGDTIQGTGKEYSA